MTRKNKLVLFFQIGFFLGSGVMLGLTGCQKAVTKEAPPPVTVEISEVLVQDVPIYSEWTASLDGFVNAAIRAQVQGYLIEQNYKEGDLVRKGQVLFKIDPRTFQAAVEQAEAQLSEQRARWDNARANLERIKPLVERKAVSQKDLDDALGLEQATRAAVIAAQANVDKAKVDLGFTRITSPIDGIAGIARAQIGNLVGPGIQAELVLVSTVDPIKAYVGLSELEYLRYVAGNTNRVTHIPLELVMADGSVHPQAGAFSFADRSVDARTGTIQVVALFPNPGNILRPGQFARIRAKVETRKNALLVPQRAVTELQGQYQVAVVGPGNKISIRTVKVGDQIKNFWIIREGLNPREYVVVEGLQKIKEGAVVKTRPFKTSPDSSVTKVDPLKSVT
ncbi:MAG TPA: efflux RND transporter periplasmic adaptor subunit, partial [Thermodesulfobacteriota bacterium]|nr:efflux RND transporter periplasmic adaptor subunit [Thermodesulfobacteriota bacterium]